MEDIDIVYELTLDQAKSVHELLKKQWWCKDRTFAQLEHVIAHSITVALIDKVTQKLIAYSNVITDRLRFALICDVVVDEAYRGKKLGKKLMEAIIGHSSLAHVAKIELKCKPELQSFYEKCGFTLPVSECVRMVFQPKH